MLRIAPLLDKYQPHVKCRMARMCLAFQMAACQFESFLKRKGAIVHSLLQITVKHMVYGADPIAKEKGTLLTAHTNLCLR